MRISALRGTVRSAVLCATVAMCAAPASADSYYSGQRITLLINFAPGGSTDVQGRFFSKYLTKHLAAKAGDAPPSIVIQNMEGGGGVTGVNYLGEIAPKDGTTIGYFSGTAWQSINSPQMFRIDYRNYDFIGYEPGTTIYFARRALEPALNSAADVVSVKSLVAGGLSFTSDKDLRHRLTLDMLGVPYRYVTGYQSSSQARLAIQNRELDFFSEAPGTYLTAIEPELVQGSKLVMPLYYDPQVVNGEFRVPKAIAGAGLTSFPDLYRKIKGTLPTGPQWDAYLSVITVTAAMQRLVVLPPGTNQTAAATLREAIVAVNEDKDFETEGQRVLGYRPEVLSGGDVKEQVGKMLTSSPDVLQYLAKYGSERPR